MPIAFGDALWFMKLGVSHWMSSLIHFDTEKGAVELARHRDNKNTVEDGEMEVFFRHPKNRKFFLFVISVLMVASVFVCSP